MVSQAATGGLQNITARRIIRAGRAGLRCGARRLQPDVDRRPALIARCAGAADVIACVGFAREHGLPVSVRGGGHSIAGKAIWTTGSRLIFRP